MSHPDARFARDDPGAVIRDETLSNREELSGIEGEKYFRNVMGNIRVCGRYLYLCILIILAWVPVAAEGGIGLGPQLGIYKATDGDGARMMGGAALRLKLSETLGLEGSINYRAEEYGDGFVEARSWPIMVTGLIYLIPIAYGAIGAGWFNTSIDYSFPSGYLGSPAIVTSETKQEFGWHFGGGVDLPLGETARLVGDVRYVFLDYDFQTIPGTDGVKTDFFVLTAGLLFGL